jgi:hypothetical protein
LTQPFFLKKNADEKGVKKLDVNKPNEAEHLNKTDFLKTQRELEENTTVIKDFPKSEETKVIQQNCEMIVVNVFYEKNDSKREITLREKESERTERLFEEKISQISISNVPQNKNGPSVIGKVKELKVLCKKIIAEKDEKYFSFSVEGQVVCDVTSIEGLKEIEKHSSNPDLIPTGTESNFSNYQEVSPLFSAETELFSGKVDLQNSNFGVYPTDDVIKGKCDIGNMFCDFKSCNFQMPDYSQLHDKPEINVESNYDVTEQETDPIKKLRQATFYRSEIAKSDNFEITSQFECIEEKQKESSNLSASSNCCHLNPLGKQNENVVKENDINIQLDNSLNVTKDENSRNGLQWVCPVDSANENDFSWKNSINVSQNDLLENPTQKKLTNGISNSGSFAEITQIKDESSYNGNQNDRKTNLEEADLFRTNDSNSNNNEFNPKLQKI